MASVTHPDKQDVRKWMQQRQVERTPPPDLEQIKRELGWKLIEAERKSQQEK